MSRFHRLDNAAYGLRRTVVYRVSVYDALARNDNETTVKVHSEFTTTSDVTVLLSAGGSPLFEQRGQNKNTRPQTYCGNPRERGKSNSNRPPKSTASGAQTSSGPPNRRVVNRVSRIRLYELAIVRPADCRPAFGICSRNAFLIRSE